MWRLKHGLSQEALALKAGLPRPNLSDIERGKREVSLRSLRALAMALDIKPGLLADGVGPDSEEPMVLSRGRMERIAQAVVHNEVLRDPREKDLAEKLTRLLRPVLSARGIQNRGRSRKGLAAQRSWLSLTGIHSAEEIESLIKRITEKSSQEENKK